MEEYGTFAKYHTVQEAEPLLELFRMNNIQYRIYQERNQLDAVFIGDALDPMIVISIPANQFTRANELTGEEIIEQTTPGEPDTETSFDKQSFIPEKLPVQWIVFGYVLCIFMLAGIFCGLTLMHSYKRLPDGTKVKMYDKQTIMHGKIMVGIGILSTVFWFTRDVRLWLLF